MRWSTPFRHFACLAAQFGSLPPSPADPRTPLTSPRFWETFGRRFLTASPTPSRTEGVRHGVPQEQHQGVRNGVRHAESRSDDHAPDENELKLNGARSLTRSLFSHGGNPLATPSHLRASPQSKDVRNAPSKGLPCLGFRTASSQVEGAGIVGRLHGPGAVARRLVGERGRPLLQVAPRARRNDAGPANWWIGTRALSIPWPRPRSSLRTAQTPRSGSHSPDRG